MLYPFHERAEQSTRHHSEVPVKISLVAHSSRDVREFVGLSRAVCLQATLLSLSRGALWLLSSTKALLLYIKMKAVFAICAAMVASVQVRGTRGQQALRKVVG